MALLAETIGRSRPTVYKMLDQAGDPQRRDVRALSKSGWSRVLDEALTDMPARVGPATCPQVAAGIQSRDLPIKARRYLLALKNATGPAPAPGSLESARHAYATDVIRELQRTGEMS